MHIRFLQIDSFTAAPFAGNPAGVCLLDEPLDERVMQLTSHGREGQLRRS
jgi:predicted PhzF superfamily epimerase YddE/YHI9